MTRSQWASVAVVFAGLGATGLRSLELGPNVVRGTILVGFGSALHALMYVLSEAVMNGGRDGCHGGDNNADNDGEKEEEKPLSARRYCGLYGTFGFCGYTAWQLAYTSRHYR